MRPSLRHLAVLCAVLAGVAAAAQDAPVATVNGQPITEKAFVDQVEQAFQTVAQDRPPDGARVLLHLDQQYGPPLPRTA